MTQKIEGQLDAKGLKVAILVGRFNSFIGQKLVDGAVDCLLRHQASDDDITVIWTPGAFEIPAVLNRLIASKKYDAIVCTGAIIRGGTPHFDFVAAEATKGIASISMQAQIPVSMGILTTDNIEQAIERAGTKAGNKGFDAAMAVIEMASLYRQL